MRSLKTLKTIIYFVFVVSFLEVFINFTKLGKTHISNEIKWRYKCEETADLKKIARNETRRTDNNGSKVASEDIQKEANYSINGKNARRNVREINEIRNVSNGSHGSNDAVDKVNTVKDDVSSKLLKPNNKYNGKDYVYTSTAAEFKTKAKRDNQFLMKILNQPYLHPKSREIFKRYFTGSNYSFESDFKTMFKDNLKKDFDINNDVMVFLHIQKTGGTHLNDRLFKQLQIPFKCKCPKKTNSCKCLNPKGNVWIYSSKFTGWPCGLHADWTQLHRCIPGQIDALEGKPRQRRYFYFSQLRDPISRYLSEYFHQSVRGHHWQDALLGCGPGFSDWSDIRPCFHTESWKGVTLDDFMACPHNLATNRMTRMLADLNKSDCYRKYLDRNAAIVRAVKWVESAKENLQQMEYFGFMENRPASDKLFSNVFKMHFNGKQVLFPETSSNIRMTEQQFLRMLKYIELDIHIYLFAKDLFDIRLSTL